MPAPKGNEHAAKDAADKATSFLHARVEPADKAAWVRAAKRWARENKVTDSRGLLTVWIVQVLNRAAE